MTTGIILLAAGESSRLGQPKQLVKWNGTTLIRHMANLAIEAKVGPVVVVLGAVDEPCRQALLSMPVEIAFNDNWSQGMGGSIAVGMRGLEKFDLTGVIVVLCDQPKIDSELLRKLEETSHRGGHAVVASRFGKSLGPPVYFSSQRFADLLNLEAGSGAKSLIQSESSIGFVESPEAEVDLDTPQDLVKLGLHH